MTVEEVRELLTVCLHGPLPQETVYRMMATLAEWMDLPKQLAANAKMLAQQTDLARQAENERDEANRQLEEVRAAYHAEFDKREGIRAWWKEHVYVPDFEEDLECEDESLEELRDLIADWSFDEAVELRSKDRKVERLEIELDQARAAADGCRLRSADEGQYECPAFPGKNQAGGG